jgi:hypothetical protein
MQEKICKMITLLQQVLDLLDREPEPNHLNEQTLYLIDIIAELCKEIEYVL